MTELSAPRPPSLASCFGLSLAVQAQHAPYCQSWRKGRACDPVLSSRCCECLASASRLAQTTAQACIPPGDLLSPSQSNTGAVRG